MAFSALPPELKLNICELLDPISSLNFATACKAQWELCRSIIEDHARLFAENESIDTADADRLLWEKLTEVLDNPRLGWYIRDLNLPENRYSYWDPNVAHAFQVQPQTVRPPQELSDRFVSVAREIGKLYEGIPYISHSIEEIEQRIPDGRDEPIIALIIHYLSHLKIFRYTCIDGEDELFFILRSIAASYADPKKVPTLPLQHLTTVVVAHRDSELCCPADWCVFFTAIPSVRNFIGLQMGGDLNDSNELEYSKHLASLSKSNAKELLFLRSAFDVSALDVILGNIGALERFSYHGGGAIVSDSASYEPRKVIQTLADRQGHALEHLTLEHDDLSAEFDEEDLPRVSLRGFQKLKTLKCDWKMIWPDIDELDNDYEEELPDGGFYSEETESSPSFDLRTILPESLEVLHLEGTFEDNEWECVTKTLEGDSKLTPNLKKIRIARWGRADLSRTGTDVWNTEGAAPLPGCWNNPLAGYADGHGYQ